jgi:5-methylcytosine-specific restriction endonuclease McrA
MVVFRPVQDAVDGASAAGSHPGDVLSAPVLLLNRYFAPVSVIPARRAMTLLYAGSALAIDDQGEAFDFRRWSNLPVRDADDGLPVVSGALRVPRVLHLMRYDRTPRNVVRLTRRNLLLRDQHQCQYCQKRPGVRGLNVDHVLPRSRGGQDTWENLVISCRECNLKKGRRTPEEAGMRLVRRPQRPRWSMTAHILMSARDPFHEWRPFLRGH